jgi:molecular chaperone GrpE
MTNSTTEDEKSLEKEVEDIKAEASGIKAEADEILENVEEIKEELHEIKENLEAPKKEEEDYKSKFYYVAAEMENVKKRYAKEKENLLKYGSEKILQDLVEVIDNFDRTVDAIKNDDDEKIKNIRVGVEMVRTQFLTVLEKNGVKTVESVGTQFDPNIHEAMAQQPAEGKENDEVIQEFQKGYKLNGRLLRAAKVIIAKND